MKKAFEYIVPFEQFKNKLLLLSYKFGDTGGADNVNYVKKRR